MSINVFGWFQCLPLIPPRQRDIQEKWEALLAKLEQGRKVLAGYRDLITVLSDVDDCVSEMGQLEVSRPNLGARDIRR